jgi:hypothetical protein
LARRLMRRRLPRMARRPYQVDLCRCNIELAARALAYFCSFAVTLCWIRGVAGLGTS